MKLHHVLLLLAASFTLLAVYNTDKDPGNNYQQSKDEIVLRKMVHELLISSGDSVSRILPVQKVSENEYHLIPEKAFAISPDSFVNIVNNTVKSGKLSIALTASVVKKQSKEVVYGFETSPAPGDGKVNCLGRNLPADDYYISFIFSPKVKHPVSRYFYWGSAALALTGILFWWKKKTVKEATPVMPAAIEEEKAPEEVKEETVLKEGSLYIGQYIFNTQQQQLELNGEKTALTIKEAKVLQILAATPNNIVERDTLQKEVWENEGVIVTRSLDMFISKLRKKLTGDEEVKIINVHGKGYKLCMP